MRDSPSDESGEPSALPTNRSFVLQFRQLADLKAGRVEGRIEHITSGEAALFQSLEELVEYLEHMLSTRSLDS